MIQEKPNVEIVAVEMGKCGKVAELLNDDNNLRVCLGITGKRNDREVFEELVRWQKEKNALVKFIEWNKEVVGTISLSKIDMETKHASIGYWIGSKYWNRGIGKRAFRLCLGLARDMGIEAVKGKIDENNMASRAIWEKYLHEKKAMGNGKYEYRIVFSINKSE